MADVLTILVWLLTIVITSRAIGTFIKLLFRSKPSPYLRRLACDCSPCTDDSGSILDEVLSALFGRILRKLR